MNRMFFTEHSNADVTITWGSRTRDFEVFNKKKKVNNITMDSPFTKGLTWIYSLSVSVGLIIFDGG